MKIIHINDEENEWSGGRKREADKEHCSERVVRRRRRGANSEKEKCSTEEGNPFHLHINMEFDGGSTINIYNLSGMTFLFCFVFFAQIRCCAKSFRWKEIFAFV